MGQADVKVLIMTLTHLKKSRYKNSNVLCLQLSVSSSFFQHPGFVQHVLTLVDIRSNIREVRV